MTNTGSEIHHLKAFSRFFFQNADKLLDTIFSVWCDAL